MPTNLAISVSDPVSAMVCAALGLLTVIAPTPAGERILTDLVDVVEDLFKHVQSILPKPATPAAAPVTASK